MSVTICSLLHDQNQFKVMEPDLVDSLTGRLIGKKPNTYTYTKVNHHHCFPAPKTQVIITRMSKAIQKDFLQIHNKLGSLSEKNTGFFGSFSHTEGRGLTKSQNFCDLTK